LPLADWLFRAEAICPLCERAFSLLRVRYSRLTVVRRDEDFCTHYREGNPYRYWVWVCSHCGYASPETSFSSPWRPESLRSLLQGKRPAVDFSGERSFELALASFKLALFQAERVFAPYSQRAGLSLRAAWLLRVEGRGREEEIPFLRLAREGYLLALDREKFPVGKMTEETVRYMIGELSLRLGEAREAMGWFSRLAESRDGDPKLRNMAREGWRRAREALEGAG